MTPPSTRPDPRRADRPEHPLNQPEDASLVEWCERCLAWLRGRRQPAAQPDDETVVRVRVDLIGAPTAATALPPAGSGADEASADNPFLPAPLPTQSASAPAPPVGGDWQFNQPVLLRPERRSSSVLVWTAVCASGAMLLWACLAPLGEAIAVQGKLQPDRRAHV